MSRSAPDHNKPRLAPQQYTVGWICALPVEYAAAKALLDEEHEPPARIDGDPNLYTPGRVGRHMVVITCLPAGSIGNDAAATVGANLSTRFPSARISLMVGVGGGVPDAVDIRLGDVVISHPEDGNPGVIQYDFGKAENGGRHRRTRHLDKPPIVLLHAINEVRSNHMLGQGTFERHLSTLERKPVFARGSAGRDRLFKPGYNHAGGPSCTECDEQHLVARDDRFPAGAVEFHYGSIASGNTVVKDAAYRQSICRDLESNILCFEMEAAGLMNNFPCLVIRGVCDYSDSHKNKKWQPYAAATAAAYAKEILSVIPSKDVTDLNPIQGTLHIEPAQPPQTFAQAAEYEVEEML